MECLQEVTLTEEIKKTGDILELIKRKRIDKDLSSAQVAIMSGFKVPLTYDNKENGRTQFYLNELCSVFKFLDITMNITVNIKGEVKVLTNPSPKLFSDFIIAIRKAKKITQTEAAETLKLSKAAYLFKEKNTNGERDRYFTLTEILKLANKLDFNIDIF